MRVSFQTSYREAVADIAKAAEQLAARQREVSTGVRVHAPSDDPAAEQNVIRERTEIGTLDRYVQAADSVGSKLSVVDSLFSDLLGRITTARSHAASAAGSVQTPAQREAVATALEAFRTDLVVAMNTKLRGAYLFGGTASDQPPYVQNPDGTVSAYQGTAAAVSVDIDRGRSVEVAWNGDAIVRGGEATDLFTDLTALIDDVRAADSDGVAAGLQKLEGAFERVVNAQARIGTDLNAIDDTRARLQTLRETATARVTQQASANLAEAATGLAAADTAYRAALAAAASANRMSLLDYLK